jgi:hypothetical protein
MVVAVIVVCYGLCANVVVVLVINCLAKTTEQQLIANP